MMWREGVGGGGVDASTSFAQEWRFLTDYLLLATTKYFDCIETQ